jgi:hypothetical protein
MMRPAAYLFGVSLDSQCAAFFMLWFDAASPAKPPDGVLVAGMFTKIYPGAGIMRSILTTVVSWVLLCGINEEADMLTHFLPPLL